MEIYNKEGKIEKKNFKIALYDAFVSKNFPAVTICYYKGTDGFLLVYDITQRLCFENVELWIGSIHEAIKRTKKSIYAIIIALKKRGKVIRNA